MFVNLHNDGFNVHDDNKSFKKVKIDDIEYYYKGIFFKRGYISGEESIYQLDINYRQTGAAGLDYEDFMGAFILIIKAPNELIFFTDNSNQQGFYISDDYITDNFIDNIRMKSDSRLSKTSICEYIVYGQTLANKTLVEGIELSDSNYYYVYDNSLKKCFKNIGNIDNESEDDLISLWNDISYGISNINISLALTGGYDSRFVLALLKNGNNNINTCISGNNPNDQDIRISKAVADACHLNHEFINIKKPDLSEQYLYEIFLKRDVPFTGYTNGGLRIYELMKNRKDQKYDVHITGDTGILYKDDDWLQELPFYNKKHFNIERYYRQRIIGIKTNYHFSKEYALLANSVEKSLIDRLKQERRETNTKSFDWYEWNIMQPSGRRRSLMSSSFQIDLYCPLLEIKSVRIPYNISRFKRFRASLMRETITKISPEIARIPTLTGPTASVEKKYLVRDIFMYFKNYCVSAIRYLGKIFLKKTIFNGNISTWNCEKEFRNLPIVKEAYDFAIEENIINCEYGELSYDMLSKLLNIYFIDREIRSYR